MGGPGGAIVKSDWGWLQCVLEQDYIRPFTHYHQSLVVETPI